MPKPRRTSWETLTTEQQQFVQTGSAPRLPSGQAAAKPDVEAPARVERAGEPSGPAPRQSVTLRLPLPLVRSLRRAAAERSVEYHQPFTQQAIVESALAQWLRAAGYAPPYPLMPPH